MKKKKKQKESEDVHKLLLGYFLPHNMVKRRLSVAIFAVVCQLYLDESLHEHELIVTKFSMRVLGCKRFGKCRFIKQQKWRLQISSFSLPLCFLANLCLKLFPASHRKSQEPSVIFYSLPTTQFHIYFHSP